MSEGSEEFALFERVFAQVLGINENEEFARELTLYAAELIYTLPPGWALIIGEGDLAGIPMYTYEDTQETEWSHPYESEYRRRIQTRRNELAYLAAQNTAAIEYENEQNLLASSSFNADTIETDYYENSEQYMDDGDGGAIDVTRNVGEMSVATNGIEIEDYEGMFAEVLGVKAGEKYYQQLASLARDLMKILPDGWELLINEADNGMKVPYYFETAHARSHWTHPFEEQYKEVIANKREEFINTSASPRSPLPTSRSRRSEISVGTTGSMDESERLALIEAMFAGALGINPMEEFAEELGDYAKELLQTLPGGWEVVVADNGSNADIFPLFVNADGESQLDHPMLAEHTDSIVEMRNVLTYGILPGVYGESAPSGGASVEPSAEYLAQERAEQEQAELEDAAAVSAAEAAQRMAQEEQAAREAEEKRAAEAAAAATLAAQELTRQREAADAAAAAAAEEEKLRQEAAAVEAAASAEEVRQREEAAKTAAEEQARLLEVAMQTAAEEETRLREAAAAEELRQAEERGRLAAAAAAAEVEAQEARAAEARAAEEATRAATTELDALREEQQRTAAIAAAAVSAPVPAEVGASGAGAASEIPSEVQAKDDDSLAAESVTAAAVDESSTAGDVDTPLVQQIGISTMPSVDASELAERSVLSEGTALALGYSLVDGHSQHALEDIEESRPHPENPSMTVLAPAELPTEHRASPVLDRQELLPVPVPASLEGEDEVSQAVAASPTDETADNELRESAHVACADAIANEVTDGTAADVATEVVQERDTQMAAAFEVSADTVTAEVVTQFAKAAAKEALAQVTADKEVEDKLEEERAAAARAVRRAAEKKAAEEAAEEARVKEAAEQAALEASATSLFQQELELARQSKAAAVATAVVDDSQSISDAVPMQRMPSEAAFSSEPDALSQTMGASESAIGTEEEKQPDSGRVPVPQMGNLAAPSVPPPVSGGFDLAAVGNNAVRMNTQYLSAQSGKDKRRTSKRVTTPEAPELAALKGKDLSKDLAAAESSGAEGSGKESGNEAGKSSRGKLRPLTKVSPKKAAQKRKQDSTALEPPQSPNATLRGLHKERLWEVKATKDSAELAVDNIKWYTLGCYEKYDDAVSSRRTICKMVVSDSQGTILIDPRADISDFDLVSAKHAEQRAGLADPNRATTADAVMGSSKLGLGATGTNTTLTGQRNISTAGSTVFASSAGLGLSKTLPAADDTRELILGRVKRNTEKSSMIRVRKDLSRMQWVVETDELEISKITDRHRKKKGVDMEGKSEDAVKIKAKNALKAMQKAKETEGDFAFQTLRDLPPMEELVEADLLQVLSNAKSFGGFTLTSKLIEHEKKVKEELASKLGNKKKVVDAPKPMKAAEKKGSAPLQRVASVSSKDRLILPDIANSRAK